MKKLLFALGFAAAAFSASAADVGVSINISQPGAYGRIDIGRFPQPEVVMAQPVIIQRPVHVVQPVYLWVPPGHQKHWSKHCHEYNACGTPVYFVRDNWYQQHVMVEEHRHDRHDRRDWDDRDRDHDHDHGRGHDKHRH
ncbi:hypothetical protein HHL11_26265 [Ramlibacter sp. G-1-2-2]|uniref:Uncharacterized protein n=1 Tax=Ramlibacter agri TaxID=2728837 RepID=A0A848HCS9_9BURK|nr:hypothetical protein [Ramlibacter agri]NML47280.1 hypothetical protein [Ramlibacter agri]